MKVFISYMSKDREIAQDLSTELNRHNISTYPDALAFHSSNNIKASYDSLLNSTDAIVAILSEHSLSSEWVRKEINEALFNEKFKDRFFPVLLIKNKEDPPKFPWVLLKINHLILSPDESTTVLSEKITKEFLKFVKRGNLYAS